MAILHQLDENVWREWLASRPESIRNLASQLPPNRLYLLKTTNHRVAIFSYGEDGTVTVDVTGQYNRITFPRRVFGIKPEDLEECDLPSPEEPLGADLTDPDVIRDYVAAQCTGRN